MLKNEENPLKQKELKELAHKAIDGGIWAKTQLDDQKSKMKSSNIKSVSQMVLGIRLLGQNYMEAYKFYWDLGEYYFGLVSKSKGILPAAKNCYIIAAENLNAVSLLSSNYSDNRSTSSLRMRIRKWPIRKR